MRKLISSGSLDAPVGLGKSTGSSREAWEINGKLGKRGKRGKRVGSVASVREACEACEAREASESRGSMGSSGCGSPYCTLSQDKR